MIKIIFFLASITLSALAHSAPVQPDRVASLSDRQDASLIKVCRGCGCRGGGGYRLPNGKCAPR